MTPKVIHYCWFGGKKLPKKARDCIRTWRLYMPDYIIKEWNECNFDVNAISYTRQAYEAKKYAFVSDVARFKILFEEGGLYFDVDVEVNKNFDQFLQNRMTLGFENESQVAPGLMVSAEPHHPIICEILAHYSNENFIVDGMHNFKTVVVRTTEILKQHGLKCNGRYQELDSCTVYPVDFFNPKNKETGEIKITENTHSIHHFDASWYSPTMRFKKWIRMNLGEESLQFLVKVKRLLKGNQHG